LLTETGIWNFHRYATSNPADQIYTRIKTLQDPQNRPDTNSNGTQDNICKSQLLYDMFFQPPPKNDFIDPNYEYSPPVCKFWPITNQQIQRAIDQLAPHKAPGPNGISNIVFVKGVPLLIPYLGPIFQATFHLSIYPEEWKQLSTIVLCKPSQPDYSLPKAYRPITLFDSMAKILSSCIADDLTYITEHHNLLPPMHFNRHPRRSTTDSLHLLTKCVMDAWASKDSFVSILFLDIKAAFPSVIVSKLLHNLKKAGIPTEYIDWYCRRLANRTMTLSFDDFKSTPFNVQNGIDQGCPISPLTFIFYNADILRVSDLKPCQGEMALGFIDDVALVARARSYQEANDKLKNMMERPGGALDWS